MYKFKRDGYQKSRGGSSRILDISCEHCTQHVTYYQKDGPGMLKRMYVDRFIDLTPTDKNLLCQSCDRILGVLFNYEKENRPAYRLYAGSVTKKITAASKLAGL